MTLILPGIDSLFRRVARRLVSTAPQFSLRLAKFILSSLGSAAPKRADQIGDFVLAHMPEDPIEARRLIETLVKRSLVTELGLHRYLGKLFAHRRITEFSAMLADERLGHPGVRLYHRLKLELDNGVVKTSAAELQDMLRRTNGSAIGPDLRVVALSVAIVQEDVRFALDLIRDAPGKPTKAQLTGALQLLLKCGLRDQARRLLCERLDMLSSPDRLYFLELAQELLPADEQTARGLDCQDWREVLHQVAAHRDERPDAQLFRAAIADKLLMVPRGERDLMNIRLDAGERALLLGVINDALRARRPMSLLRLGDGEAYAFPVPSLNGISIEQAAQDNSAREMVWWGQHPSHDRRAAICSSVREAVQHADIVGLPSIYRIISDLPQRLDFNSRRTNRGLMTIFSVMDVDIDLDRTIFTEERCHQVLFDLPTLQRLTASAERVVVVGCWTKEQLAHDFLDDADFVLIPPQEKVRDASDTSPPLFEVYETINAEIARLSAPGALVLVAAGIIGKMFLQTARSQGAVALDIGSVIDYLAGRKTRRIVDLV